MGFNDDFKKILAKARERCRTDLELSELTGINQGSLSKLFGGKKKSFNQDVISRALDALGARLVLPDEPTEQTREVCFVDAKVVRTGKNGPPIVPEEYVAVPLVGEVGAGPGIVAQDEFLSWVLVYRRMSSVARRSNLLAVEVGKNQKSMVPLLHPGDIVLVDLDDFGQDTGFRPPGNIYLVREPGQEGGGKIKRVSITGKGENAVISYYSENTAENEPEPYFLSQDFDGDLRKAIVGKVIWAWTDLSRK